LNEKHIDLKEKIDPGVIFILELSSYQIEDLNPKQKLDF
jgi:hypothetical protein